METLVVNVIKFITFHMNSRVENITMSCRVFVIDIYMAKFAGINYTINIYRNAH